MTYWPAIIDAVHATNPAFVFIAEAYWDTEWTLQRQGFDFCYDKRLYDRVVSGPARSVRGHLQAAADYQERLLRFIETHDEPRAADTFTPERQRAAAVAMSTLQGARMYHAGQLDGLHTHIPVFLARGPEQPAGRTWRLRNALDGEAFERDGDELHEGGLYVGMGPWEAYFLELA